VKLEEIRAMLADQNYLERKARNLEKAIRELEDKLREKKRQGQEMLRKIARLEELISNPEAFTAYGLPALKEKLHKFDKELVELEVAKEGIRRKKRACEAGVIGKEIN